MTANQTAGRFLVQKTYSEAHYKAGEGKNKGVQEGEARRNGTLGKEE